MRQIWFFHGGESFSSYDAYLQQLSAQPIDYQRLMPSTRWPMAIPHEIEGVDFLAPSMPNKQNAVYDEWRIVFEKLIPLFSDHVQLVGHSLGAMFLAKFLHENPLPTPVARLVLVAAGYDDTSTEDLGSFSLSSAKGLEKSAHEIHLFHSQDDPVVNYSELQKYQNDLPMAITHSFQDRGHFLQPTFPELYAVLSEFSE